MMADKISQPLGSQTPDVHEWRRSLRSPSPGRGLQTNQSLDSSLIKTLRSRSPSPRCSRDRFPRQSRSPSPNVMRKVSTMDIPKKSSMKHSSVVNGLRKSIGASLTSDLSLSGKLNKSVGNLANIEAEYIKNLQQQIYFLELESNYLREQARKATEMHPQMTHEAEKMLQKLREMQTQIDNMDMEMKRKESSIGIHTSEKERLQEQLQHEKDNHLREKRLLTDELVTMKKDKDRLQRELAHKDEQLLEAKSEIDRSALALKNAELKINTLKAQLEQRIEQHNLTQLALEEKRTQLLSTETQLRETEEKYYSSTVTIKDKLTQDLRDEIRLLHQKVKETELSAEKDRFLRDKISEEMSSLVQENSALNQRVMELTKQLEREKELRETTDHRHKQSIGEMVSLKDRLQEIDRLRDELRLEKERSRQYLEQLTNEESTHKRTDLQINTLKSRLTESDGMRSVMEAENEQLKKDKVLLVDHVAEMQRKLEDKDRDIYMLKSSVGELETKFRSLGLQKTVELDQQRLRWEEFSRLADSMKSLSQTMMSQTVYSSTQTPRTLPQQY
ncbi:cilia- and flagella-associated protein 58-like isoform X1 [Biomphalaria glabrata]|uniref:Cilia- and flagella-associated protein 58-like n=1 Tax=Biomphalaria glabrata TaxID=6526 RepID=A0A9U8E4V5_BIOGL|nr:cilia- and flagella-associated protein 58-like [Biomphalaria glabrata]KAI8737005.1 cilia- and flagella-associated protein 58-like isoform X1 [Biomphalaria glabrata]